MFKEVLGQLRDLEFLLLRDGLWTLGLFHNTIFCSLLLEKLWFLLWYLWNIYISWCCSQSGLVYRVSFEFTVFSWFMNDHRAVTVVIILEFWWSVCDLCLVAVQTYFTRAQHVLICVYCQHLRRKSFGQCSGYCLAGCDQRWETCWEVSNSCLKSHTS